MSEPIPQQLPPSQESAVSATPSRRWQSSELFGAAREVEIRHGDQIYRLRITLNDKLILQK